MYINIKDMTPFYVGKGSKDRWKPQYHQHNAQPVLVNKIRKMGMKNIFVCFPFTGLDHKDALVFERMLINIYGRKDLNIGPLLNLTDGGDGLEGYTHSEETKAKMRATQKRLIKEGKVTPPCYWKGKCRPDADKKKISETLKGSPSPMKGKKHSETTKRKMSVAAKARKPMTEKHRKHLSDAVRQSWAKRKEKKNEQGV
ncbi:hypothetical protein LCGC14_1150850 [marine sediment metagenome]|uniref:Nuclease associated modular domain-containing protein n=1 Tax=marine sediment metagenome TaxID=412755 RepID=A0A0F9LVH2_9ZZZZ